jgi:hypothetical protein
MTIEKALGHFGWKLDPKNNQWKPTEKDLEAYNFMCDYVEQKQREQFQNYSLMAKLYVWAYQQHLIYYNATVFDNAAQVAVNKILDTDITILIENLKNHLNQSELYGLMDKAQMPDGHWVHLDHIRSQLNQDGKTIEEIEQSITTLQVKRDAANERLNQLLAEHPEIKNYAEKGEELFSYQDVEENLKVMINAAINQFS